MVRIGSLSPNRFAAFAQDPVSEFLRPSRRLVLVSGKRPNVSQEAVFQPWATSGRVKPYGKKKETTTTTSKTGEDQTARRKGHPSPQDGKAKPQPERERSTPPQEPLQAQEGSKCRPQPQEEPSSHPKKEWRTPTTRRKCQLKGEAHPNHKKDGSPKKKGPTHQSRGGPQPHTREDSRKVKHQPKNYN